MLCCGKQITHFVIHCVPLGHQHTIDSTPLARAGRRRKVTKGTVELGKLVNSLVANERLANKDYLVGSIDSNKLWKSSVA
jgi:hypothetical protein